MPKYRIMFSGTPIGGLNPLYNEFITREVDADNEEQAALDAYKTHDHIELVTGGSPGVYVESAELTVGVTIKESKEYIDKISKMDDFDIAAECLRMKWFVVNCSFLGKTLIQNKFRECDNICDRKRITVRTVSGRFGVL
jgi:hypothetical protein